MALLFAGGPQACAGHDPAKLIVAGTIPARAVERIEAQAAMAWPAVRSVVMGNWLVRLSDGYTKRANAASAIGAGARLGAVLPAIEAVYAAHGRPALFRLTSLADPDADALLAAAGYAACDPSVVMVARGTGDTGGDCRIAPRPDSTWLALSASIAGHGPMEAAAHAALLNRIVQPACFATVFAGETAVGVGIGVAGDAMVGLFALAVAPGHRRGGHGRAIVACLRRWADTIGARSVWLQVADDNGAAIALYAAMGFTAAYRYHYRVAPGAPMTG